MNVADLMGYLDAFAPRGLAEEWDNVGLLLGDPGAPVERVMACLSVTAETAEEAIGERADLIVSHHPILFRGVKQLRADGPAREVWRLARAGIAVYSPHTAFDNCTGGINDVLAERLGLVEVGPLVPSEGEFSRVVVFAPEGDRERIMAAAFAAGAGRIGAYSECSFATRGEGTFLGDPTTNPTIGRPGSRERVEEARLEFGCPESSRAAVVAAIRAAHSYEEPAIDAYALRPAPSGPGRGRVGSLRPAPTWPELGERVRAALGLDRFESVPAVGRSLKRVAIACGAADDFLDRAIGAGADVFVTGEARYHTALRARESGIGLILLGHHASERIGVERLAERIGGQFPSLRCWASRAETDPLRRD